MRDGEELVYEPFQRLIAERQLVAHRHFGFWACMDTLKEKKMFDEMYARGERPWALWESGAPIERRDAQSPILLTNQIYTPNSNGFHPKAGIYAQTGD